MYVCINMLLALNSIFTPALAKLILYFVRIKILVFLSGRLHIPKLARTCGGSNGSRNMLNVRQPSGLSERETTADGYLGFCSLSAMSL